MGSGDGFDTVAFSRGKRNFSGFDMAAIMKMRAKSRAATSIKFNTAVASNNLD